MASRGDLSSKSLYEWARMSRAHKVFVLSDMLPE